LEPQAPARAERRPPLHALRSEHGWVVRGQDPGSEGQAMKPVVTTPTSDQQPAFARR
jgi:hypothetical protein